MKLEMTSAELYRILSDSLLFAARNVGIPAIESVRLETSAGVNGVNVIAVATDRFVLGVSRATAEGDAGIGVTISADDARTVARIGKTSARDSVWRRAVVDVDADADAVDVRFSSGESVTVRTVDADFPSWRRLLDVDVAAMGRPTSGVGVDPLKLAVFSKVSASKRNPMQIFPGVGDDGRLKPIAVAIGDDFAGLVMPVKSPAGGLFTYATPEWLVP